MNEAKFMRLSLSFNYLYFFKFAVTAVNMCSLMRARCYLVWTRDAETRLMPDLHLISIPASDWSVRPPACLWLADSAPTPLAAWIWSDLRIWSELSRLITAYLSTLYPHCYHTLSLSPASSHCSFTYWCRGDRSPLIGFLSQHPLAKQMSKVCWENKWSRSASFLQLLSLLQSMAQMWEISDFW